MASLCSRFKVSAIFEALADIMQQHKLQDTYPEDIMVQPRRTANQFPIITITNFSCGFRKNCNKQNFLVKTTIGSGCCPVILGGVFEKKHSNMNVI